MISKASFEKRNKNRAKADNKISFDIFVVVRHTRSGDKRIGIYENKDTALDVAERIADEAARGYGYGSSSVFPARLEYTGIALRKSERILNIG